jgi:alpha-L-rhamnosidase
MRFALAVLIGLGGLMNARASEPEITAKWIWLPRENYHLYNDTIVARRTFSIDRPVQKAELRITADTFYRLLINGTWINDGPCRSWPSHYQYDIIDVTQQLKHGENEIRVIAKYFGVGTFHQIPQQAGLLAQLDITDANKRLIRIETDATWDTAEAGAWLHNTPKKCIQMGPFEIVDARKDRQDWLPAAVRYGVNDGPWKDLNSRDCPLLTREPFSIHEFKGASVVKSDWRCYVFPTARTLYPGLIEANGKVSMASAVATIVDTPYAMTLHVEAPRCTVTVNGKRGANGGYELTQGENLLLMTVSDYFGHWNKDTQIRFIETNGYTLKNPLNRDRFDPWCFVPFEDAKYVSNDYRYPLLSNDEKNAIETKIRGIIDGFIEQVKDESSFKAAVEKNAVTLKSVTELSDDPHWQFQKREVVMDAAGLVEHPEGLIESGGDATVVRPSPDGDIELVYDFGTQNVGYYDFDLSAEAGLVVDVAQVEYIASDGRVQHTGDYRNAFRYICKKGSNRFTSLERRSGRFLFITFRNQTKPVTVRSFRLIESTYPVESVGGFACSDPDLEEIWKISAHTLKLCMEDTYTDCPLYEQTHWVGDARNEAVFGFTAFGAGDLSKRCARLTAYSLDKYPITLCQTPSTWDVLLPAWSFLWGISVWEAYDYTGDEAFLREMWPYVKRNLKGAEGLSDERGLFSGPFWNMFDWSGIDDGHNTVTHNSMFVVGAIDAALKCADELEDDDAKVWLNGYRSKLVTAINGLWDESRKAYPDSIHNDGSISTKSSVHTSFLALLYDIADSSKTDALIKNVLTPPDGMVRVGSPFAIMYEYEALDKFGKQDAIIDSIRKNYTPMIRDGATTVWESFPEGTTGSGGFPTRSHCHAWSSAPVHFLNRIVLGIIQTQVGGAAFEISPRLCGLSWAQGRSASNRGAISVEWKVDGDALSITATAPEGVAISFRHNASLKGKIVTFNGNKVG